MDSKLKRLRSRFKKAEIDSIVVTNLHNVRWLTGYSGTNGVAVVSKRHAIFLTDFRYTEQAAKEIKGSGFKLHEATRDLISTLKDIDPKVFGKKAGFESEYLQYKNYRAVNRALRGIKLVPTEGILTGLREVKDKSEVSLIRRAVKLTDEIFSEILPLIKPGVSEMDLMAEIEYRAHLKGAYASFETIVASGYRGALPHGRASAKKIKKGEMITFDFGVVYKGYTSDMTRTVVVGKASEKQKKIYDLVLRANIAGIKAVKPGVSARDVDTAARDIITEEGYGDRFGHALGHGIGICVQGDRINIHEGPILAQRSKAVLKEGNIVTVEPGIYIPRWGGVRIEDDVLVTKNGCSIMTKSPKNLMEL
ncbi:MAG: M24 family metallopeptidase [candidate division Zixibacteria bacterium]|nr:M24 family metallopeptidase [candidate division Zixibacteria bacterium]